MNNNLRKGLRILTCVVCPAILGGLAYMAGKDDGSYDQYFYDLEHMKKKNDDSTEEASE